MPCEDQEERTHQGSSHAGTLTLRCSASRPLRGEHLLSEPPTLRYLLQQLDQDTFSFSTCITSTDLSSNLLMSHAQQFFCVVTILDRFRIYIYIFLKEFFLMWTIFKSLLNWLCWLKKKDVQLESCELSFIWGRKRSAAPSISDSSERLLQSRLGGKSKYKFSVKGKFTEIPRSTQLTKGFFVSHEGLMSPWRDLVLL